MTQGYKLWKDCPYCIKGKQKKWAGGTEGDLQDVDCPQCDGKGYVFFGWCSGDLFDLPENLPDQE